MNLNNCDAPNQLCPICSGKTIFVNSFEILNLATTQTFHCYECGVYFRTPLPSHEAVATYYKSRYFRHPDAIEQQMALIQGAWLVDVLAMKQKLTLPDIHYIEFGAGRGWLVEFMQSHGAALAVGYEPDDVSVEWGRTTFGVDLREGFLADALKDDDYLDGKKVLLSMMHVLEHLHSPLDVLSSLRRQFACPYLFIEVPDARWEGPVMALDTFPHSSMGQHFWSFTEQSLEILLNKAGFSVVALAKGGNPHFWDDRLAQLKVWNRISTLYRDWEKQSFNLKDGAATSLQISMDCFLTGVKMRLQRLSRRKIYDRLDLPIIRILAKATN